MGLLGVFLFVFCFKLACFTDPPCVVELECAECVPDNMPLVTSPGAANGSVSVAAGGALALWCGGGGFAAYPPLRALQLQCEAGRYRVRHDRTLRHLLELGCQQSIFEDVLHQVEDCAPPLQGRAYLMQEASGARQLASACYDAERGVALRVQAGAPPPPQPRPREPPSLLANFNHMFDSSTRRLAERLYSDDARMNRRLRELLKHDRFSFADQTLTSVKLLDSRYFEDQMMRVTDFASNRVAAWRSVAEGNLRHLQRDVAELLKLARPHDEVDVFAGTHGVASLRAGGDVFLQAGGRFPVPKYLWTVVRARRARKALALLLLNDPFVSLGEARAAELCAGACERVTWLRALRRRRHFERPLYGLVFCCSLRDFTDVVAELPQQIIDVPAGNEGMLTELFF